MEVFYMQRQHSKCFIMFVLMMSPAVFQCQCPSKCKCSSQRVDCHGAGLKKIPHYISKEARFVDFSNNPSIRIDKETFLNYSKLHILVLNNCGLTDPIDLPSSLQKLTLAYNHMTRASLKAILSSKIIAFKFLDLRDNRLNVTSILPYMPKSIEYLDLSGNNLKTLRRNSLSHCKRLRKLTCKRCHLQQIESNAFHNNSEIYEIDLSQNELTHMPDNLFQHNAKLVRLVLKFNHIEQFNSSKLKLRHLLDLQLSFNRLKTFDIRYTKVVEISLENNMISQIHEKAFEKCKFIHALKLQHNKISTISQGAFKGVKFISELLLHRNNLSSIPAHIFSNVEITKLFLHQNQLSSLSGVLLGVRRPPTLLTLFLNDKLTFLNISDFEKMSRHSELFITCRSLKGITGSSRLKTSIRCSPSVDLTFRSQIIFWAYGGYECHWVDQDMQYICRACAAGFYSNGNARTEQRGTCLECPPGSFYQNELASTNCKNCPVGQFVPPDRSPGKDASYCQTCPKGTNTNISAETRACFCLAGFYRLNRFGQCKKCQHEGYECMQDFPQLKRGYWITWNGTGSTNQSCKESFKKFVENLQTFDNSYAKSTMDFTCQLPTPLKCPIHDSCLGGINASCSSGYTGALCAVCSRGYSRKFNRCIKCSHPIIVILEFIGYFAVFLILCLIISLTDRMLVTNSSENDQHHTIERRTFADTIVSSFKILIGFYQVFISLMHAFSSIGWPENVKEAISWLEYIQFEVIRTPSLRCIKPEWEVDSIKEFWLTIFVTLMLPAITFTYFILKTCFIYFRKGSNVSFRRNRDLCGKNCLKVNALFLFATYTITSAKILQVLPLACHSFCTVRHNGNCLHMLSFLRSDYSVPCSILNSYRYTMIAAYCSLVIPLGLPALLLVLLWRYVPTDQLSLNSLRRPSTLLDTVDIIDLDDDNAPFSINSEYHSNLTLFDEKEKEDKVLLQALKFTFENYDRKCWYWEVLEMIRKLIMTVGVVILFNQTNLGLLIVVIIAIAFSFLHALKKPIKDRFENAVQLLSLLIVPLNLTVGAILESETLKKFAYNAEGDSQSHSIGLIFVIINSLIFILIVGRFFNTACSKLLQLRIKKGQ